MTTKNNKEELKENTENLLSKIIKEVLDSLNMLKILIQFEMYECANSLLPIMYQEKMFGNFYEEILKLLERSSNE